MRTPHRTALAALLLLLSAAGSFAQKNISLLSSYTFSGQSLAGCWHYEDSVGHKYGLIGAAHGIAIMDLTDSVNPVLVTQLPGVNNLWHEVKVQGKYAYAVCEGVDTGHVMNGLQIINLSYLPDSAPTKFYTGDGSIANQLITGHSVTTAGHYVYINGHNITALNRGVLILDITDPWNPVYVGAETHNYSHDSYVRGDTLWSSEIAAGQFGVYDISNRSNPVLIGNQSTPGNFNHNTWLSDDSRTIFTTDEHANQPLGAYDVSDLSNITLLDTYYTLNMPTAEVHNVRVLHDFLINPSYGSQVTVVDATHPNNLIETGSYPTGSSLCWDADPYYSNGMMLATDMNSGTMYVLMPEYKHACYLIGHVTDSVSGLPLNTVSVTIVGAPNSRSTDPYGDYRTGIVDSGTYCVQLSKSGYVTKTVCGVQLINGQQTVVNVQLVTTNSGIAELQGKQPVAVFPNPAHGPVELRLLDNRIRKIEIFSPAGQLVRKIDDPASLFNGSAIRIKELAAGTYSVRVTGEGLTWSSRFVIE